MKTIKSNKGLMLAALCGASATALMTGATYAQDVSETASSDTIIVTGSRIQTDNTLDAASPVVALGAEDIRTSGEIDIGALLRESPQLQNSLPASFSAFNGTPLGASLLNLRGQGEERTLVIENGRRHVSGIEGEASVDVNTISTALLERIEVLTGGASAVYGADAVSGVVNFIMRDGSSFDGIEVRTQAGISSEGDAGEYFLSVANGFETADGRGSMVFAAEYSSTEPIFAGDRDFAGSGQASLVSNSSVLEAALGVDPRFANVWIPNQTLPISSGGGVISLTGSAFVDVLLSGGTPGCDTIGSQGFFTCQYVDASGTLRAYNPGDVYIGPFEAIGGDAVPTEPDDEILLPDSERFLMQAAFTYDLHDNIQFFADAKYVFSETTESNQVNGFNDDIPIALDNPFIPTALRTQIDALIAEGITPSIAVSRDVLDINARSNPLAERKTLRAVTGVRGDIPGLDWTYEVAYVYGRTDADITSRARVEDRYFAAIDAVVDPATGNIVCRSEIAGAGYVPPSSTFPRQNSNFGISTFVPGDGQCVPISIFGPNSISAEGADFIFQPTTSVNEIEQQNFVATVAGDSSPVFSLPAGPVDFALGYEYRREKSSFQPAGLVASGLTFGSIDSRGGPSFPSSGDYSVNEFFAETRVPVLADIQFVEELEITGAYRYSDYDTFGETDTWSLGARWTIVPSFTLRATQSRAVRIPNIGEAFSPQFTVTLGATQDPCNAQFIDAGSEFRRANCALLVPNLDTYDSTNFLSAFVPGVSGGNPDLEPEEADTFTVGAVWRPQGEFDGIFDGLTVTLDYYDIEIDGKIDSLGGFDIAQNCVDAPTINNQFCAAVDRDPTFGFITGFRSGQINLAAAETAGLDWRVDYVRDMPNFFQMSDPGELRLSTLGTYFIKDEEVRDVSAPDEVTDISETLGRPEWIFNVSADWSVEKWRVGWSVRYESEQFLGSIEAQDIESNPDFANITRSGTSFVHDVSASYFLSDDFEIYGGVNNLTNEEPYLGALSRPTGPRGTFFFAGVNATF